MKAILSISTFFLFIFVVFSSVAKEYEIGSIEAKGMTCKWFSSIKQNCTKEAVQMIRHKTGVVAQCGDLLFSVRYGKPADSANKKGYDLPDARYRCFPAAAAPVNGPKRTCRYGTVCIYWKRDRVKNDLLLF